MIFKAKDRSFLFPVINSSVIRHIYLYFTHHYNYIVNFNNSFLITCVFFFPLSKFLLKCLTVKTVKPICLHKSILKCVFQVCPNAELRAPVEGEGDGPLKTQLLYGDHFIATSHEQS